MGVSETEQDEQREQYGRAAFRHGSSEGPGGRARARGLQLGSATLTGRHVTHDPPTPAEVAAMRADAAATVRDAPDANPVEIVAETGKRTRIRFHSPDTEVPARLLLRLGADARLVSGDEVRDRARVIGDTLLRTYRSGQ